MDVAIIHVNHLLVHKGLVFINNAMKLVGA
jgi:hypothetical protein